MRNAVPVTLNYSRIIDCEKSLRSNKLTSPELIFLSRIDLEHVINTVGMKVSINTNKFPFTWYSAHKFLMQTTFSSVFKDRYDENNGAF